MLRRSEAHGTDFGKTKHTGALKKQKRLARKSQPFINYGKEWEIKLLLLRLLLPFPPFLQLVPLQLVQVLELVFLQRKSRRKQH